MTARLLLGRPVADAIWADLASALPDLSQRLARPPCLALVQGPDGAAQAYARTIQRAFERHTLTTRLDEAATTPAGLRRQLAKLSADQGVDGVLLLAPLPGGIAMAEVVDALDPDRDVDGLHPFNLGRLAERRPGFVPATALGGLRLLQHYGVELTGRRAVVVGRSPVVGLPLALLLLDANATVTVCHSRTPDLAAVARGADVLCVAAGRARLIGADYVKTGAVVLDFGTNPTPDGSLVGDVDADAVAERAAALTPVPNGTGSVTTAVLAAQTLSAARARLGA
ncbi:MAG: bifunctional 5,10-methylenetetrahydrofolate dehydrogenase/5,10-methenyltetrahydrofolate cyclohydrolase [Chloroflexi bacterium]|nr:bifunctional 5,10-methylenetetrahydrofolate dehydrogenase/5,10-methenyltetrahydrofolate cyclohydrolase [Chloroflexota bacterium]